MRADDPVLVEHGQARVGFQQALDDEHHIGSAGIVFIKHQRAGVLHGPRQQAFAELRHLPAVTYDNCIASQQVDAADLAVQIDADARPVQARRHLLDVGRFAGTVIALQKHAPVACKTRKQRDGRVVVEAVARIGLWNMFGGDGECRHLQVRVDAENAAYRNGDIGCACRSGRCVLAAVHQAFLCWD